jgi:hypothetical protein
MIAFPYTFTDGTSMIGYGAQVMANLNVLRTAIEAQQIGFGGSSPTYTEAAFALETEYEPSATKAAHVLANVGWTVTGVNRWCCAIFTVGTVEVARQSFYMTTAYLADQLHRSVNFIVPAGKKWKASKGAAEGSAPEAGTPDYMTARTLLL